MNTSIQIQFKDGTIAKLSVPNDWLGEQRDFLDQLKNLPSVADAKEIQE